MNRRYLPSGDQSSEEPNHGRSARNRRSGPPADDTTNTAASVPLTRMKAIQLPSGDHAGEYASPASLVSRVIASEPTRRS